MTGSKTSRQRGYGSDLLRRWAAAGALVLAGGAVLAGSPAQASTTPVAGRPVRAAAPCPPAASRVQVPAYRRNDDVPQVTAADLAALPQQQPAGAPHITTRLATGPSALRTSAPGAERGSEVILPAHVRIPVLVHIIRGTGPAELPHAGPQVVRGWIRHLNGGFHGDQSPTAPTTRYTFVLRRVDYHQNRRWWRAQLFDSADRQMRRALHRGGPDVLNVYVNGGGPENLGWSHFPWQYSGQPRLDGVTATRKSFPGGSAKGYNTGDTLIHETGHWLGLLHTFQGGCQGSGDLVADTPAEARPSFYCDVDRDTCPQQPGKDPVRNFMDYSLDSCMNTFTPDQAVRMDRAYLRWRIP